MSYNIYDYFLCDLDHEYILLVHFFHEDRVFFM